MVAVLIPLCGPRLKILLLTQVRCLIDCCLIPHRNEVMNSPMELEPATRFELVTCALRVPPEEPHDGWIPLREDALVQARVGFAPTAEPHSRFS